MAGYSRCQKPSIDRERRTWCLGYLSIRSRGEWADAMSEDRGVEGQEEQREGAVGRHGGLSCPAIKRPISSQVAMGRHGREQKRVIGRRPGIASISTLQVQY